MIEMIEAARTVEELAVCIDAYYGTPGNESGGSLHNVLDDFGYDDSTVRWCVEHAEATFVFGGGARPDESAEPDPVGAALGRKLLEFTVEDRAAANDRERCECGHAMSLHNWWEDGAVGLSSAGPCEAATCGCKDAVVADYVPKMGSTQASPPPVRPQYEQRYLIRGTTIDGPAHAAGTEVEVRLRATVVGDRVVDDDGVLQPRLALLVKDWTGPVAS